MNQATIITISASKPDVRINLSLPFCTIDPRAHPTNTLVFQDEELTIGIDQVRQVKHFLSTKPISVSHKLVLITNAENMTREAQNALLKTLEEPPSYAQIILITGSPHHLLPTIISRCYLIKLTKERQLTPNSQTQSSLESLSNLSLSQKIALTDKHAKDRQKTLKLTSEAINLTRSSLKQNPSKESLYNLTLTLYTQKLLKSNTNVKLTLDNFFFNFKSLNSHIL